VGLDITVYSDICFVLGQKAAEDDDRYTLLYVNPGCSKQADGIESGLYTCNDEVRFRAGGYGWYNWWRECLAKMALDVNPVNIWDSPEVFAGKPFVELINFSDCEGIIGPKTSAKLHKDFKAFHEQAKSLTNTENKEGFLGTYECFMGAFEVAATKNGVVKFH
jgi:hypothetical protein